MGSAALPPSTGRRHQRGANVRRRPVLPSPRLPRGRSPETRRERVLAQHGYAPAWSPDGTLIAYLTDAGERSIRVKAVAGAPSRAVHAADGFRLRRCAGLATALGENDQRHWILSYTWNIGRDIEMTTNPTMAPTTTIMIGSRIDVSDLTAASTSSS